MYSTKAYDTFLTEILICCKNHIVFAEMVWFSTLLTPGDNYLLPQNFPFCLKNLKVYATNSQH